jgi:SAM-dependent methyltransferase
MLEERPRLLHIAPEVSLMRHFKRLYKGTDNYITADLESPLASMHFNVQHIPLGDCSVDVVICNHLMEHVEDDLQAMRELYRILKKGGWGVLLSPVDLERATTYEDDSITDPEERTRIFGQYDHRRLYGNDFADRLREAGFEVEDLDYVTRLSAEDRNRFALPEDHIYVIHK